MFSSPILVYLINKLEFVFVMEHRHIYKNLYMQSKHVGFITTLNILGFYKAKYQNDGKSTF